MAHHFLGGWYRLGRLPGMRRVLLAGLDRLYPGAYLWNISRTKYYDQVLLGELAAGARQLVILGAGFDTRAYRFEHELGGVRVFEVDHPGTSSWKRERLRQVFGKLPPHVRYVATDFDAEPLGDVLARAGFDPGARTFFLWEGVSMYLTAAAVDRTLALASSAPPGSGIAFDYADARGLRDPARFFGASAEIRYVEKRGEPFRFGLEPSEIERFLADRGLTVVDRAGPEELARLVTMSNGRPRGRVCELFHIVHARRDV
jgi:methyltransferase (TIGR00027 family)